MRWYTEYIQLIILLTDRIHAAQDLIDRMNQRGGWLQTDLLGIETHSKIQKNY